MVRLRSPAPFGRATVQSEYGGFPERPKGADCKSVVTDFGGPNPPSPTRKKPFAFANGFFQLNPPMAEEIHLRWMKSLRDEICLAAEVEADLISSEAAG